MSPADAEKGEASRIAVSAKEIRLELELILKSAQFIRAEKQGRLLTYLCQKCMEGNGGDLKESLIAVEVFHRDGGYSPTEDSTVRVQVYELRRRLREYYAGEGRERPVRIEIPRGGYSPRFIREAGPAVETLPGLPLHNSPATPRQSKLGRHLLVAAAMASLSINIWLALELSASRPGAPTATIQNKDYESYLELFVPENKPRGTLLCLSNPPILLIDGAHKPLAQSFVKHQTIPMSPSITQALRPQLPFVYLHPTADEYTGMGEAACAYQLGRLMQNLNLRTQLTQARFMNWDRAVEDNVVVLGMPFSNPWMDKNVSSRLFQNTDGGLRLLISPSPADPSYNTSFDPQTGRVVADYGVISRERTGSGASVLILAGRTSFGTFGVGDFFADPHSMNPVFEKLKSLNRSGTLPRNFVVLLKIQINEDIPVSVTLVKFQASAN
jgi:hypothetical protein